MKKVVLASFLACALVGVGLPSAFAQAAPAGQVQMPAAEFAVYNNAETQTTPQAKAAAFEAYLTQFPQSAVKQTVLETLMALYASFDAAKAQDAADRLLQVDPTNIKALYVETLVRNAAAGSITDPAAKQAAMDTVASYAQKGLAAPKPKDMTDADFETLKTSEYPSFYSAIGYDALLKKDTAAAIDAYKKELAIAPPEATKTPGAVLQDIFYLGEAYFQSTPPDYLNCTFYTSRAVAYAPDAFKAQMSPTAKYCYKKYHGKDDGYDAVLTAATANLNPPDGFFATIKPAPTTTEIIAGILSANAPDQLATSDKEYILQNGTPDQAATVWATMNGKSFSFPGALVIASTPTQLQVALSDDAVQSKTADFTFNLTPPDAVPDLPEHATPVQKAAHAREEKKAADLADTLAKATAVGQTVTLSGTFSSYTAKPLMITMTGGAVVLPKAAAKAPARPVHKAAH